MHIIVRIKMCIRTAMKKLICQLTVCLCVFLLLCFALYPRENDSFYSIPDIPGSECVISENDGYTLIGKKSSDINDISKIEVTVFTENVPRGGEASLRFRGKANEIYNIRVYYSSGLSQSRVFEPVISDDDGEFGWSWRISSNARKGEIRIIVTSDSLRVDLKMNIC